MKFFKLVLIVSTQAVEIASRVGTCPTGWKFVQSPTYSRCVRFYHKSGNLGDKFRARTWSEAEKFCQDQAQDIQGHPAHLLSVHSTEEQDQILHMMEPDDNSQYWIGLRMPCSKCDFEWSDHSTYDYNNWRDGEPNNVDDAEHCVEMDATADMLWNDNKCTGRLSYICAYYVSGNPVPMPTAPTTGGGCPNGGEWIKFGGWCYKFNTARGLTGNTYEQTTAKEASRKCKLEAQGADLAMMPTPFHNAFVATMLTNRAWIGITTDTEKGVHFTWIDQSPLTYSSWRNLRPRPHVANERVGVLLHPFFAPGNDFDPTGTSGTIRPGDWEDVAARSTDIGPGLTDLYKQYSICGVQASSKWTGSGIAYPNPEKLNCPQGYQPHGSSCYKLVTQQKSYSDAQAYCEQEGSKNAWPETGKATIASIWNDKEELFVYSQLYEGFYFAINDLSKSIWLGISVEEGTSKGNLTWDDGMHMSWSNWGNHQPQVKRGQNCAYVDNVMKFPKEWSWKMDNNCGSQRSFICKLNKKGNFSSDADQITIHEHLGDPMDCEKGWETHDGSWHCFKPVANKVIFSEAKRRCQSEHSNLVSIFSDNSNEYAKNLLRSHGLFTGVPNAWIGAERDSSGGWQWTDRSQMSYQNFEFQKEEHSTAVLSSESGKWSTTPSDERNGYICKKIRKFSNCVATIDYKYCGFPGIDERDCHNMGCCWDPTKQYHCFYANADARALEAEKEQSGEATGHSAGFAAGMTALAFVILYAVAGTTYYFVKK